VGIVGNGALAVDVSADSIQAKKRFVVQDSLRGTGARFTGGVKISGVLRTVITGSTTSIAFSPAATAAPSVYGNTPDMVIADQGAGAVPRLAMYTYRGASSGGSQIYFAKSRASAVGSTNIVADGDNLGGVYWVADDGTDLASLAAAIWAAVDGAPGANDMPAALMFATTPDGTQDAVARMRIGQTGMVTIDVDGDLNAGDHVLELKNGTNCSEIDPSETSWTNCSSSRDWKTDITEVNGDSVLAALRFVRPYRYRYTGAKVRASWADPDTMQDVTKRAELRAKIREDSLQVRQGFMAQDVWKLRHALNPAVDPADTTGYSLDPVVQGQQVAILYLMEQNDAQQEQIDNLQYIALGLAALNGVVLVVKKGVKGKDVLVDEKEV